MPFFVILRSGFSYFYRGLLYTCKISMGTLSHSLSAHLITRYSLA